MSRLDRFKNRKSIAACITVLVIICCVTYSQCATDNRNVSIIIRDTRNTASDTLGPKLFVLINNQMDDPVMIDRHLSGVPLKGHNSLWVEISDKASGKSINPRAKFKRIQRIWKESNFVKIEPNFSYGPMVDLMDYFDLDAGKLYAARFRYKTLSPEKVGAVRPWSREILSKAVLIRIPYKQK